MDKNQQLSPHFKLREFINRDDEWAMVPEFIGNLKKLAERLELVRTLLGNKPIKIEDGLRSPARNARLKNSAKQSFHLLGMAADFTVPGMSNPEVQRILRKARLAKQLGGGFGVYDGHTHVDIGPTRKEWTGKSQ